MAWIKTIPFAEADEELRKAMEAQHSLYPKEYDASRATPARASCRRTR
jgi:hypothetical protein